ncbi:MAG: transglycosylase SLT domain-containing protein [Anaerolineales bacterium]|nr:transglycosylase SLT domain-containing protein [Anaerolineales bacterium]
MGRAACLIFPGAILGSVLICVVGYFLTAGVTYPAVNASAQPVGVAESALNDHMESSNEVNHAELSKDVECKVSKQYPKSVTRWCGVITKYAVKYRLPPDLIAAMVWQESGGNPAAYSGSGAVGLMQIMPRDGIAASFICSGGACFANRPSMAKLKDPEFNVKYGTRMLAGLVKQHGSVREALKAYGPMDSGYYYADKVLSIYKRYGN